MIEIVETYHAHGIEAEIRGGRHPVKITERPARKEREWYDPNMGTDARAGRTRWKTVTIPHHWLVKRPDGGVTVTKTYAKAICKAIWHAKRK